MARLHAAAALACMAASSLCLGGCVGALVVGGLAAAGGAGYAAGQERGVNGAANDFAVKTDIETAFIKADPRLQIGITTTVYGGRVLLTGRVNDPALKAEAEQIAGRMHDVRALYNEIVVAPPEGVWDGTKDAWITAQVRSKMVLDPAVRSINYTIDTENGSVFLIGSARSQRELDHATRIARYVPGVRRVVSYVEIRSGSPVASAPAAISSPGVPLGAAPAGAAPETPVEVQKL